MHKGNYLNPYWSDKMIKEQDEENTVNQEEVKRMEEERKMWEQEQANKNKCGILKFFKK